MKQENKNLELAKRCCLLSSVIDEHFWENNSSYKTSIDSFYSLLESNELQTIVDYFSSFSEDNIRNHYKHIKQEDSVKIDAEILQNYTIVMQELNSRLLSIQEASKYNCIL